MLPSFPPSVLLYQIPLVFLGDTIDVVRTGKVQSLGREAFAQARRSEVSASTEALRPSAVLVLSRNKATWALRAWPARIRRVLKAKKMPDDNRPAMLERLLFLSASVPTDSQPVPTFHRLPCR